MLELKKIQFMLFLAKSSSEKSQPGEIDTVNVWQTKIFQEGLYHERGTLSIRLHEKKYKSTYLS